MLERIDQPVRAGDGASANLALVLPDDAVAGIYWIPAMGVGARHYAAFADALAARGIATALHELRGTGSSGERASRRNDWGYRELLELDIPAGLASACEHRPSLPWNVGGHSLGAQLAALYAARHPSDVAGIAIVASGSPYWRMFQRWQRPLVRFVFAYFRALSTMVGYFPGRRVGFAGNEARSVVRDWAASGVTGRYLPRGIEFDYEQALARVDMPVLGVRMEHDRYVSRAALAYLLDKMPRARRESVELRPERFTGGTATHFSWMKEPGAVADEIARWLGAGRAGLA